MKRPRKKYSASVRKIVREAMRRAAEMKANGWTREDSAKALKAMFDDPKGGVPDE